MINERQSNQKFYYPSCQNNNCDGVANIEINKNDFSLNYECEKDKEHSRKNIYFKTFERFYLKESDIDKCIKCNHPIENFIRYKCKICDNYFCFNCVFLDEHIRNCNKYLIINSFRCSIHNANYFYFCKKCNTYLCNYCHKDELNEHYNHYKKNIYELMPTKNQIEKIKKRLNDYDELIKKIDSWMEELNNKIARLKRNIKDEKELLYKLIYNYNQRFFNYSYYNNLNYILDYIKHFNNEYLDKFFKYNDFPEKTKTLLEYFIEEEKKEKEKRKSILKTNSIHFEDLSLKKLYSLYKSKLVKITDNYIFLYTNKEVKIIKYIDKSKTIEDLKDTLIPIENEIKYVSVYDNKDQTYTIYTCLYRKDEVIIFNFNINSEVLTKSENKIYNYDHNFKIAIQLTNDLIAH